MAAPPIPPLPPFDPANSAPGTYNWNAQYVPHLVSAIAKVRAGTANCKIDCIGDSTTAGALVSGSYNRSLAWPNRLAAAFTRLNISSNTDSMNGASNLTTTAAVTTLDSRVTFGAGWVINQQGSFGGYSFNAPAGVTTSMSFTPVQNWNTVEIEYITNTSFGVFTLNQGGGAAFATVDARLNPLTLQKATYSTGSAATSGALNVQRNGTGGQIFILSVRCYDSATSSVQVANGGWASSQTADWVSSSLAYYSPLSRITSRAANCLIIALGINDWNSGVSTSTFSTNIQTIINTQIATGGDVILVGEPQSDPASFASVATQTAFMNTLIGLSNSNRVPFVNLQYRWNGYTNANAYGYMDDQRHPNQVGSDDWGSWIGSLVYRS